jgi:hypothetical protein
MHQTLLHVALWQLVLFVLKKNLWIPIPTKVIDKLMEQSPSLKVNSTSSNQEIP